MKYYLYMLAGSLNALGILQIAAYELHSYFPEFGIAAPSEQRDIITALNKLFDNIAA